MASSNGLARLSTKLGGILPRTAGPVGPGGGIAFVIDYDVDFTALPSQELFDGNNLIDNKTWEVSNKGNSTYFGVINGAGLSIIAFNPSVAVTVQDATRTAPLMTIPLPQLSGDLNLTSSREVWLWARMEVSNNGVNYHNGAVLALESNPVSSPPFTRLSATMNTFSNYRCILGATNEGGNQIWAGAWTLGVETDSSSNPVSDSMDVIAIRYHGHFAEIYCGIYSDGWPLRSALTLRAILREGTLSVQGDSWSAFTGGFQRALGMLVACEAAGNIPSQMILKNIKVEHLPVSSTP